MGHVAFGYEFRSLTCPDHTVTVAVHDILSGTGLSLVHHDFCLLDHFSSDINVLYPLTFSCQHLSSDVCLVAKREHYLSLSLILYVSSAD